jgi:hypothetical protein
MIWKLIVVTMMLPGSSVESKKKGTVEGMNLTAVPFFFLMVI